MTTTIDSQHPQSKIQSPRVKRRLFTLAAALSLLLGIAVTILWLRSRHVSDTILYQARSEGWLDAPPAVDAFTRAELRTLEFVAAGPNGASASNASIGSTAGIFKITWSRHDLVPSEVTTFVRGHEGISLHVLPHEFSPKTPPTRPPSFLGFHVSHVRENANIPGTRSWRYYAVEIPHWSLLLLTGILPLLWWRQQRRARARRGLTLCPTCNYDLRATPDRCPECGLVPTTAPA